MQPEREDVSSDVVLRTEPRERGSIRVTLRCCGHAKPRIVAEGESEEWAEVISALELNQDFTADQ